MNYKVNAVCSLLIFFLGILFFCYDNATVNQAVLIICGIAFFVPGLLLTISAFAGKRGKADDKLDKTLRVVCGVGGMALAVVIWLFPGIFEGLVVYLFGALLIFAGVFHLIQMSSKERLVAYPGWLLLGPIINIALGVILLAVDYFHQEDTNNGFWVVFITASGMIIFGCVGMIMSAVTYRSLRAARKAAAAAAKSGAHESAAEGKVSDKLSDAMKISGKAEVKEADKPAAKEKETAKPAKPVSDDYQGH